MTFKNDLSGLITNMDEHNTLWRALLQSIHDHGGGKNHLENLLADAKKKKTLISQIAKIVVGPVWSLTERVVNLEFADDDFECPAKDFRDRYNSSVSVCLINLCALDMIDQTHKGHPDYGVVRPAKPCRYRLQHFGPKENPQIRLSKNSQLEHANWRELVVYLSQLEGVDMSHFSIFAMGSKSLDGHVFPNSDYLHGRHGIGWSSLAAEERHRYFYLVRVYD